MKIKLLIVILISAITIVNGQSKKVLLEEFTGAWCGNCPMGSYFVDSMEDKHPDLISVALHAYQPDDAMSFDYLDPLYTGYSAGAPLANIDRVYWGGGWSYVAQYQNSWDEYIQEQLQEAPVLTVDVIPSWNDVTRLISANINVTMLSDMPTGDYRITLYVVEDSVVGIGSGYDQESFYDEVPGNPFFGMGNPIQGFVHRHVVRAVLPGSWGAEGIISSSPVAGQTFNHTIEYTLPVAYDETKVSLVAFVYKLTSNHLGDEVYNVAEKHLLQLTTGDQNIPSNKFLKIYPNPAVDELYFESGGDLNSEKEISICNLFGQEVLHQKFDNVFYKADVSEFTEGIYVVYLRTYKQESTTKMITIIR